MAVGKRYVFSTGDIRIEIKEYTPHDSFYLDTFENVFPSSLSETLPSMVLANWNYEKSSNEEVPVNYVGKYFELELLVDFIPVALYEKLLNGTNPVECTKLIKHSTGSNIVQVNKQLYDVFFSGTDHTGAGNGQPIEFFSPNTIRVWFPQNDGTFDLSNPDFVGAQVNCSGTNTLKIQFRDIFRHAAEMLDISVFQDMYEYHSSIWDSERYAVYYAHKPVRVDLMFSIAAPAKGGVGSYKFLKLETILKYALGLIKGLVVAMMEQVLYSYYPTSNSINKHKFFSNKNGIKAPTDQTVKGFGDLYLNAFAVTNENVLANTFFESDQNENIFEWLCDFSEFFLVRFGGNIKTEIGDSYRSLFIDFKLIKEVEQAVVEFDESNMFDSEMVYPSSVDKLLNFNCINTNGDNDLSSLLFSTRYNKGGNEYTINMPFSTDIPTYRNYTSGRWGEVPSRSTELADGQGTERKYIRNQEYKPNILYYKETGSDVFFRIPYFMKVHQTIDYCIDGTLYASDYGIQNLTPSQIAEQQTFMTWFFNLQRGSNLDWFNVKSLDFENDTIKWQADGNLKILAQLYAYILGQNKQGSIKFTTLKNHFQTAEDFQEFVSKQLVSYASVKSELDIPITHQNKFKEIFPDEFYITSVSLEPVEGDIKIDIEGWNATQ